MLHQTPNFSMLNKVSACGSKNNITWQLYELLMITKLYQVVEIIVLPITQIIFSFKAFFTSQSALFENSHLTSVFTSIDTHLLAPLVL